MRKEVFPGATIGIYGDDNRAADLAMQAQKMGYQVAVLSNHKKAPALRFADYRFVADVENWQQAQDEFVGLSEITTYASDWLPFSMTERLDADKLPQGKDMLELTDDHALSRALFESQSMNILPYVMVSSLDEVALAAKQLGYPVVVKPIFKHQHHEETLVLEGEWDLGRVARLIDGSTLIMQTWLTDVREFAMTAVRDQKGELSIYPMRETQIDEQNFRRAWLVSDVTDEFHQEIESITRRLGQALNYVGAYTVSFLYNTQNGFLYVRDVAGGITETTQLYGVATNVSVEEQHLRAITGQAMKSVMLVDHAMMMPFTEWQEERLYRHWSIKSNWDIVRYQEVDEHQQAGYVLVTGTTTDNIMNQLKIANIWDF